MSIFNAAEQLVISHFPDFLIYGQYLGIQRNEVNIAQNILEIAVLHVLKFSSPLTGRCPPGQSRREDHRVQRGPTALRFGSHLRRGGGGLVRDLNDPLRRDYLNREWFVACHQEQ